VIEDLEGRVRSEDIKIISKHVGMK